MRNTWEKIKAYFSGLWTGLRMRVQPEGRRLHPIFKYLAALLLIALILFGTIALITKLRKDKNDESSDGSRSPEIAQVYEPSIGSPLAPDVANPGNVAGSIVPTPTPVAPISGVNLNESFRAPSTGVDDDEPVRYENPTFKFTATLPAGAQVTEQSSSVTFASAKHNRYYTVSVTPQNSETLTTIEAQLNSSPSISAIQQVTFNGIPALQFRTDNQTGTAFIYQGAIYYLMGDSQYFTSFRTI